MAWPMLMSHALHGKGNDSLLLVQPCGAKNHPRAVPRGDE